MTDRYLAKFGDPIAMRESSGKDEAKESSNSGNGLLYAIGGGVAIVAVGSVASILIWKKRKNKVNE